MTRASDRERNGTTRGRYRAMPPRLPTIRQFCPTDHANGQRVGQWPPQTTNGDTGGGVAIDFAGGDCGSGGGYDDWEPRVPGALSL